jgi:survival of motor neuron protein-interacting protein 1
MHAGRRDDQLSLFASSHRLLAITMSQQPCLPVPLRRKREDGSTIDFNNIESMDAMEYMAAVVQQANALPDVFVAEASTEEPQDRTVHVPIDGSAASLSYLFSKQTAIVPPPTAEYAPPRRAWVDTTLSSFSELRSYLDRCHKEGVGGKGTERMVVPPLRDRSGWHVFCVGEDEAQGNAGSYFDEDDESNGGDDDAAPQWKQHVPPEGHDPSVQLLLQMDQVMVRRVLSHLAHYVQDGWSPSSKQRSIWFYALLARLERPIHRDDAATLYGLLKDLTLSRAKLDVSHINQNELARLNTLIAVVGLYFEQGGGYGNVMGQSLR